MKHTAGPWTIDFEKAYCGAGTETRTQARAVRARRKIIAAVLCKWRQADEQSDADARLIAAAPELLEACKYVVSYHREHDSGEGELFGLDFVTTCIAAIAKATGGQQ